MEQQRGQAAHVLITALGTQEYPRQTYFLDTFRCEARFAPVALLKALSALGLPTPTKVLALLTDQARDKAFAPFCAELAAETGLAAEDIPIKEGGSESELWQIFQDLVRRLQDSGVQRLTLDVTFGLRSLPFIYYAIVSFLTALDESVQLAGVYYGASQIGGRIVDLQPVVELAEWYFAARTFHLGGSLAPLTALMRGRRYEEQHRGASEARTRLGALERVLAAGLPLEVGLRTRELLAALAGVTDTPTPLQPLPLVGEVLADVLGPFALEARGPVAEAKGSLRLDRAELARELALARWYVRHHRVATAAILLREWFVNYTLWTEGRHEEWLLRRARTWASQNLSRRCGRDAGMASELSSAWQDLRGVRNSLAHAGFAPSFVDPVDISSLVERLERLLASTPDPSPKPRADTRLLISSLGLKPGALFTVARHYPDHELVVLTSAKARTRLDEVLAQAGRTSPPLAVVELQDPFTGFTEKERVREELRPVLQRAGAVVCNLTGGTAAMQYLVERLAEEAARYVTDVVRVVAVDRRPEEEQRQNPYVPGEVREVGRLQPPCEQEEEED